MGRLFWKFFVAFWLALLTAGLGVGSAVWIHKQTLDPPDKELAVGPRSAFVVNAAAATLRYGGTPALRALMNDWNRAGGRVPLFVVDETGQELLGRSVPREALARARRLVKEEAEPRSARRVVSADQREYLFFVPAENERPPGRLRPAPALPIVIGIIASLAFSALLAWYLSKPIRNLRWAFETAAAGKLDTRIGPLMGQRRDEIADLGRDFDRMAQQLQQLVDSQRRLLHDVSHELRSPLARLQAAIGLARQQPEKLDMSLDRIERESGRLDELVGELLTLSRLEAGINPATDEYVDLVELVKGVAEDARFEAQTSGRRVCFSGEGEVVVKARAELLHRAFENVIRNAVKYTREGTAVEVNIEPHSNREDLVVTVSDRGPGVPESDLQAVFEPFFRSEAGRSAAGFGLGLAIARGAIEAHGGSIRAMNRDAGGLRVEIVLPMNTLGRPH